MSIDNIFVLCFAVFFVVFFFKMLIEKPSAGKEINVLEFRTEDEVLLWFDKPQNEAHIEMLRRCGFKVLSGITHPDSVLINKGGKRPPININ